MTRKFSFVSMALGAALLAAGSTSAIAAAPAATVAKEEIPRAASTPGTPKNWRGPAQPIKAQAIVDRLIKGHPEIMSITMHAVPPGQAAEAYTMIAGSFPDRIGNTSSPGDIITAKKGVTQVESKWGTPDFGKKVSVVVPIKTSNGDYVPVAMVIAFYHNPALGMRDTDYMAPAVAIRNALAPEIASFASLFDAAN